MSKLRRKGGLRAWRFAAVTLLMCAGLWVAQATLARSSGIVSRKRRWLPASRTTRTCPIYDAQVFVSSVSYDVPAFARLQCVMLKEIASNKFELTVEMGGKLPSPNTDKDSLVVLAEFALPGDSKPVIIYSHNYTPPSQVSVPSGTAWVFKDAWPGDQVEAQVSGRRVVLRFDRKLVYSAPGLHRVSVYYLPARIAWGRVMRPVPVTMADTFKFGVIGHVKFQWGRKTHYISLLP